MNNKIEQAKLLATFVHFKQQRQDGEDYINHPYRMVVEYIRSIPGNEYYEVGGVCQDDLPILTIEQENISCVIWLHDVLEDGYESITATLIAQYFGDEVANTVIALTHIPRESYNEYIARVFRHPTAWIIKFLDLKDNTSYDIPEEQRTKYIDACVFLMMHGVKVPDILMERLEL